jgi:RinA family phage transcriptional activator
LKMPYKIKAYVEWQLRHYPEDKRQLERYKADLIPSAAVQYDRDPVNTGKVSNPTETLGIAIATNPYIQSLERSIRAIDCVLRGADDTEKQLIDLVYWRKTHTVYGAAEKCHISKSSAYRRLNKIIYAIAAEIGLVNLG